MRLFPNTRASKQRFLLILAVFVGVCAYRNVFALWQLVIYQPREGDIVFQSLPHGELSDAIEGVTESPWSHCGVLLRVDGRWHVVEAIGHVRRTPFLSWVMRGRWGRFEVYRPRSAETFLENGTGRESLAAALETYMGRPYDFRYAPGDEEIYCSELVFKAYRDAFGVEIGRWEELGQLNWRPFESFIKSMEGGPVPLQRRMITPVGLTRSERVSRVFPENH